MPFTKLIVAGSSGVLADAILPALLASTSPKFDITVLTRADSGKTPSIPGAKVIPVDYDDHQSLVRAVSGADAIVSLLASLPAKEVDLKLLKAAQEAGVRRIFPSEYTLDVLHPYAAKLMSEGGDWPASPSPVRTARAFLDLENQGGPTSFTTLMTSAFMDPWLAGKIDLFDPANRKIQFIDDGNRSFTGCSFGFIAAALVAALRMDEEATRNKRIPVAEVRATMEEVAQAYEEVLGAKFEREVVKSSDLLEQRDGFLASGNLPMALFTCIKLGALSGEGPGDLEEGFKHNGDGYLTVRRKTLKELVAEAVRGL